MKNANYNSLYKVTCEFLKWEPSDPKCGKPVGAIYISDDPEHKAKPLCCDHALKAEAEADGPVYWACAVHSPKL